MFVLETARLLLRDVQLSDEADYVAITQHPDYQRFYSEADCDPNKYRLLTRLFVSQAQAMPRTAYQLAVIHKQHQAFIGTVSLRLESDQQAAMGCGLAVSYQGQGLMKEAAEALARFGFDHLKVHRLYAETLSENHAAIQLCASLGMQKEAVFSAHRYFKGRWWQSQVLAVTADQYNAF